MDRVFKADKDPRELGEALLEAQRHAHSLDRNHPMHTRMIQALHYHTERNPSHMREALKHIVDPSPFHSEHHEHVLNILESTPMPDAIYHIGKYAQAGNMHAFHAAHGWMMRFPSMTHYFHRYVMPHLERELSHGKNHSWHPYLHFLKKEAENYRRKYPNLVHPYEYYRQPPDPSQ
jgi:hypothetical protein